MNKSESIAKIAMALSKAQSAIKGAVKDSKNPFFKSDYANLESVIEAIRGPMIDNELSFTQMTSQNDLGLFVNTLIMHSSGEWLEGSYPIICKDTQDPQKVGAALTYARRFSLASAFGVPQIDDDGNTAAEKPKTIDSGQPIDFDIKPPSVKPKPQTGSAPSYVSPAQVARLWAIQRNSDKSIADVMQKMKEKFQIGEAEKLTFVPYNELIKWIEGK